MLDQLELLTLRAPAGNGQRNNPRDIAALDNALRRIDAYKPPSEYADEPQSYATAPMIRALERFQEQNGFKIDGYADPNGPTERAINNRLLAKPRGAGLLFDPPARLAGTVGNGFDNRTGDVAAVQRVLGALGEMPEDPFDRPRGFIDENTTAAIKSFQRKRGLADDGWLAPNGETERALHSAVADLAREKGPDWLRFAERAGRAQARMMQPPSARSAPECAEDSEPAPATPVAWRGTSDAHARSAPSHPTETTPPGNEDVRIEPAQAGDIIVPPFLWLLGALGGGAVAKKHLDEQAKRSAEGQEQGGRTEFIPPRVDEKPYRGTDTGRPPLDPKRTGPSPLPSEPPLKLPHREEIRPETLKPSDWTLITPAIRPWSAADLALLNRGNERTQGRLVRLRVAGEDVAKERTDVDLVHIGGTTDRKGMKRKEYYAANPLNAQLGIKTTAGSALADLTFQDRRTKQLYHISLYRVTSGTNPRKDEVDAAIKLAVNTKGKTKLIVMVPNVRSDDFVDGESFKRFLHATLDSLRGTPEASDMSDPATRERIIRYFTQTLRK